jgi:23S rRNA (cytidine1920-2'-O)/16S rRNA (cytidine1409-2'-O)-methyltransferase
VTPTPKRLDVALAERGLAPSRQRAQALIMTGSVHVNDRRVDKPGHRVAESDRIAVKYAQLPYVSRGGLKLEAALAGFRLDVSGLACLDVGASTGGFTDCLLQHGAARVHAVDVGYGQLAWALRQDARVVVIERANIRYLPAEAIAEPVDLVTIDVSFISLRIVVPAALRFLKESGRILALIKPQFEAGKGRVGKGGVVRDPDQHAETNAELGRFFTGLGLSCSEALPSPILGPKGNREFFMLLQANGPAPGD